MKIILSLILSAATLCARDYRHTYSTSADANSKAESLARAMGRLPYGANIKKIEYNGYSVKTCTEEKGNYNCKIIYSK
jgi:hypothetical protein